MEQIQTSQKNKVIEALSILRKAGVSTSLYPLYGDRNVEAVIPLSGISLKKEDIEDINYGIKESQT